MQRTVKISLARVVCIHVLLYVGDITLPVFEFPSAIANCNARFHQPTSQPNQRSTVSIARFTVVEILLNHGRRAEVVL